MRTRLPAVLLLLAWLLPVTAHASGVTGITATPSVVAWQADQQHPVGRAVPLSQVRTALHEVPGTAWHAVLASGAPRWRAAWHACALPGDDRVLPVPRRCAPPARAPPSTAL
ncbi:hypothetical protein [Acrocarpospora sp. B8E8]|uniref:hypothetical protein n=1 Tax=Acrocarpospora sp. B8E8 TaxID=3153572 RepID=UPI00325DFBB6